MRVLLQDIRYGLRMLRKKPMSTSVRREFVRNAAKREKPTPQRINGPGGAPSS